MCDDYAMKLAELSRKNISADRILGYDIARAIAIIGMVAAHLGTGGIETFELQHGNASALFAVLAGCSMSIIMSRGNAQGFAGIAHSRQRILVRGAILFGMGILLAALARSLSVVLMAIALIFLFLGPLTYVRTKFVWLWFIGFLIGGSALTSTMIVFGGYAQYINDVYPLFAWLAYGTLGILTHRVLSFSVKRQIVTLVIALPLAVAGQAWRYLGMANGSEISPVPDTSMLSSVPATNAMSDESFLLTWLTTEAHSGSLADVTISSTIALAVISLCLLLGRTPVVRKLLYPLQAMGSMSLTSYFIHGLTLSGLGGGSWLPWGTYSAMFGKAYEAGSEHPVDWDTFQNKVGDLDGWVSYTTWKDAQWEAQWSEVDYGDYSSGIYGGTSGEFSEWATLITVVFLLLFCSIWRLSFKRGPMEAFVAKLERRALRQDLAPREQVFVPIWKPASQSDDDTISA